MSINVGHALTRSAPDEGSDREVAMATVAALVVGFFKAIAVAMHTGLSLYGISGLRF